MAELRDVGRGGNDTAGVYGTTHNARPDPVHQKSIARNLSPLYKQPNMRDDKYATARKGTLSWVDTRVDNRQGASINETDMVWYNNQLNGSFTKGKDEPWALVDHLFIPGVIQDDVLVAEGSSKANTLQRSGKLTILNTGPQRIMAGQRIYWDLPPPSDEATTLVGGAALVPAYEEGAEFLWTMPYDDTIHRGTPAVLHKALTERTTIPGAHSDHGIERYGEEMFQAATATAFVALGALLETLGDGNLPGTREDFLHVAHRVMGFAKTGRNNRDDQATAFRARFIKQWLQPHTNLLFTDPAATLTNIGRGFEATGGTTFRPSLEPLSITEHEKVRPLEPSSIAPRNMENIWMRRANLTQLMAAEELFFYTNKMREFYSKRIIFEALTSADSGKDMDVVFVRMFS